MLFAVGEKVARTVLKLGESHGGNVRPSVPDGTDPLVARTKLVLDCVDKNGGGHA